MAERRMFAKSVVLSDNFLDMPMSARCLYFTLGMLADDDGFINSPKSIMRQCGCTDGDMQELLRRQYVVLFDSGVIVIRHWRMNNYLRSDRYIATKQEEKQLVECDEKGAYTLKTDSGIPKIENGIPVGIPSGIPSIGKDSLGEDSINTIYADKPRESPEPKPTKKAKTDWNDLFAEYTSDPETVELLGEWMEVRKAKRAANTEKAIRRNLDKLAGCAGESGLTVPEYLKEVVRRSWAAFYEIENRHKQADNDVDAQFARVFGGQI